MDRLEEITARVSERIPEAEARAERGVDMDIVAVAPEALVDALTLLRDDFGFDMLTDVCATDWLPREPRYDLNYHLLSTARVERLRVKVRLPDEPEPEVASASSVWTSADWLEREVYDFFGIVFTGHPDLRRILMPDEWIGYPLRKDYPVGGVPVEYRIEPAYVGANVVPEDARPAAGGVPARLRRDRGRMSSWTWTGPPAVGVSPREPVEGHEATEEGAES
jgi:NADH-quinone oxidoreductase subunit C